MWLLIKLMDPSGRVTIILNSGFTEVGALVPYHWQWFDIGKTFHNYTEITDPVLGGVLIHLIEVRFETGGDHINLSFLHSVRHCRVVFQEPCLLIILVTQLFELPFEDPQLVHETRIWVDYTASLSNGQNCRV